MTMRGIRGEATVVMMAFMLADGLVFWLATGNFHMIPMHGGGKGMHREGHPPAVGDPGAYAPSDPSVGDKEVGERIGGPASSRDDAEPVVEDGHGDRIPGPVHWKGGNVSPARWEGMTGGAGGINQMQKA